MMQTFMLSGFFLGLLFEALHSSKLLMNFYQTVWRHIPEDITPHGHCHENLTSNNNQLIFLLFFGLFNVAT
jgi:hypothetical protein